MIQGIPIEHFLIVSTIMFFIGVAGFIIRRNLITMLMAIELILNSVNINFVVFNRYLYPDQLQGQFFSLFIVGIAAAEASVAIALIINIYRKLQNIDVENVNEMMY
ncbi:MAG TPA: NADH-quinone oxidoreductase subunit NuoK [Prolixibacteraceae bacterium]|nr:NADH-quinone oxidoreductase subunit NuoK [Odoribacter sp.]MDP3644782.1 NADH-quinone oxidoreductase subunit NuoK [Bacteroidota bacterium]HAQ17736.1 NADH-quinone oxidoreductase subunit NuoK [Prolixibacteraceae bacterium]